MGRTGSIDGHETGARWPDPETKGIKANADIPIDGRI